MFNSGILDVVIGLVVMYLQLSLVCTAINELIASWLKKRAKELERGIGALLTNPQLVDKFYAHPLIKGLRPDGSKPSYIPSRTFALALMDIVRRHSFEGTVTLAIQAAADKKSALVAAQAAVKAATAVLTAAQAVRQAADEALAAAGAADKLAATKVTQDAANQQAVAEAALTGAQTKFEAAEKAVTDATHYQTQVTTDAAAATLAETAAQTAETAAKANPKDEGLQQVAATARQEANTAADRVAPSAASLLTEARDKIAGVQKDVVPPELKTALLALMDNAGTNLNKAQANLEQWFDDAMDRVSGVYKRKSQVWIVSIAILVTVFANVDSLQVADSLSRDKALRESLVAAAPELAKADRDLVDKERSIQPTSSPTASPTTIATPSRSPVGVANPNPSTTPTPTPPPTPSPTPSQTPSLSNIKASLEELKKLGVPIGYIRVCTPSEEKLVDNDCPNAIDAALIDAEAALKRAQGDLDKANAALQKTGGDSTAAQAAQALASAQVDKAKGARDQAIKAAAEAKQVEAKAVSAESSAQSAEADAKAAQAEEQADSHDKAKHDAAAAAENKAKETRQKAEEARRKADNQKEMLRVECPKCRKESELSASELKQRLPTTHGYKLSQDFGLAFAALFEDIWNLLYSHWLGWLLTALAMSLGAPFWFDTLNRLMVIRSTVKPHEKSQEQESKDNPENNETNKS